MTFEKLNNDFDFLCKNFLENTNEDKCLDILRFLRCNNLYNIGSFVGEVFCNLFPHSVDIKDEYAINLYYDGKLLKAYDILEEALKNRGINQEKAWYILFNQHFSINTIADRFIYYDKDIVKKICERKKRDFPLVTLTITTCKRFDLFEKTINSVINCFDIDRIDHWICIDDNSSEEDRLKMKEKYPFFDFYWKTYEEKGHPQSMNILMKKIKTPYFFHLEDDWKFFVKKNYINDCFDVLNADKNLGQCLINKNYSEIESDIDVKGGFYKQTSSGLRYFEHEFAYSEEDKEKFIKKYGPSKSSSYWPHFSFRPSLLRTDVIRKIGEFNEKISHFEMDFAYKYVNNGYKSAFFEGIYCLHIGRLTSERNDESKLNAYKLNNEIQFYGKEEQIEKKENEKKIQFNIKTLVVNLDRREDRWNKFNEVNNESLKFLNYVRFSAIDGMKLKPTSQLQQIFETNDYNMRKGMVGCAMSHLKMYCDLINDTNNVDAYLIFEDDIELVPEFEKKFNKVLQDFVKQNIEGDILFLGHHPRNLSDTEEIYNKEKMPEIEKWDSYTSFINSLGGTTCYLISKKGAEKLLNFIDNNGGMSNGIDTMMQKSANDLNVYYCKPHLIYSECYRGDNTNLDTDIQHDYSSLTLSTFERLNLELEYYKENNIECECLKECSNETLNNFINENECDKIYFYKENDGEKINSLIDFINKSKLDLLYYTLSNKVIFIVSKKNFENKVNRYFHRFKIKNKYLIDDALIFL
jgi:GR25 family glycosyltransferase involved in LPS biosynthesis